MAEESMYEKQGILDEYLLFHYGTKEQILPSEITYAKGMEDALGFAERTARYFPTRAVSRGLDLGCAVGRSTFEMGKICEQVLGIDYSHSFIDAADRIKRGDSVEFHRKDEGHQSVELSVDVDAELLSNKVSFMQGDAMNLPADLGTFDHVHAANLLCRLPDPEKLLRRLPGLVKFGGTLVLATPCTWLAEFTPPNKWPKDSTQVWLKGHLGDSFDLVESVDEPFLIRETARKFQWTSSLVTVWKRK